MQSSSFKIIGVRTSLSSLLCGALPSELLQLIAQNHAFGHKE